MDRRELSELPWVKQKARQWAVQFAQNEFDRIGRPDLRAVWNEDTYIEKAFLLGFGGMPFDEGSFSKDFLLPSLSPKNRRRLYLRMLQYAAIAHEAGKDFFSRNEVYL